MDVLLRSATDMEGLQKHYKYMKSSAFFNTTQLFPGLVKPDISNRKKESCPATTPPPVYVKLRLPQKIARVASYTF